MAKQNTKSLSLLIPLDKFTYKISKYNHQTKERSQHWAETLQEVEEWLWDNLQYPEFSYKDIAESDLETAKKYIRDTYHYTDAQIEDNLDTLKNDIIHAYSDAWACSYQDEWIKKYQKILDEQIIKTLNENNLPITYKMADTKTGKTTDEKWDADAILVYDPKNIITRDALLMLYPYSDGEELSNEELADAIIDNLDCYNMEQQLEHIDYYGSLGDTNDWFNCFKDYEETSTEIKNNITEKPNLKHHIDTNINDIRNFLSLYITDNTLKQSIERNLNSIEAIITRYSATKQP